jgi:Putative prokaryotic signal transducing protein
MSEDTNQAPDGFCSLGQFDVFEAERLLKQFEEAGIRFQIDKIEGSAFTSGGMWHGAGYRKTSSIEIFVHQDDEEKATKILRVDWKV